ncbi:MAG TPA: hypothetical protein VGP47_09755 [Parachlamydiaceae bacterium]|nr:hypothetical protein [Parachlamydiaceae bacterium]
MKHLLCLMLICLTFQDLCVEADEPKPSDFTVDSTISSDAIGITQNLTLQMTLTFPSAYHPNIDRIRGGLVQNAGLYEPPFAVVGDKVHPPQEIKGITTQQLEFILSPQIIGKHYLSAHLIQFDPHSKEGKKVVVASDVFTIDVSSPKVDVNLKSLIEPPMPMSMELPIALSQANRRAYFNNQELLNEEAEKNVSFINSRAFPWLAITAAMAVLLVIAFSRWLPSRGVTYEIDPLIKEKNEAHIKMELQRLASSSPQNAQDTGTLITRLDFLLRRYLLNRYGFPAFSFTAQEMEQEISTHDELSSSLREGMNGTFRIADQIKFAKHVASQDEFHKLIEIAKQLAG